MFYTLYVLPLLCPHLFPWFLSCLTKLFIVEIVNILKNWTAKESASGVRVSPNQYDPSRALFRTCERRRSLSPTSLIKSKCRKECFQKLARRRREERGDSLSFVFPPFSDNNPSAPLSVRRPNPVIYSGEPFEAPPREEQSQFVSCRGHQIHSCDIVTVIVISQWFISSK